MGHYDSCFEAERVTSEKNRREDLLNWIADETMNMSNYDLELVWDVVEHVNEYHGLTTLIKRLGRGRD